MSKAQDILTKNIITTNTEQLHTINYSLTCDTQGRFSKTSVIFESKNTFNVPTSFAEKTMPQDNLHAKVHMIVLTLLDSV